MITFIAHGVLGQIPAGTWANGGTKRAYLDIGDQRIDDCWVADYFESSLTECMSRKVELSFCRLDRNGGNHLCAIKHEDGKIERVPVPTDVGFTQMIVTSLLWGGITFLTTWLVVPIFLIPIWLLSKIGIDSETVLGSVTFGGLFLCWMAQLVWVLFYSKKLSPKVRLRTIKVARAAFD